MPPRRTCELAVQTRAADITGSVIAADAYPKLGAAQGYSSVLTSCRDLMLALLQNLQTDLQTNHAVQHGTWHHKPGSPHQKCQTGAHS
jgi:hypothetical protein